MIFALNKHTDHFQMPPLYITEKKVVLHVGIWIVDLITFKKYHRVQRFTSTLRSPGKLHLVMLVPNLHYIKCHYLDYQFNAKIVSKTADEGVHLLTGLSVSSSLRIDLPSISAGISTPAMSSRVGAKSTFNTI